MSELSTTMAKLAGIRDSVQSVMGQNVSRNRSAGELKTRTHYPPEEVQHYFDKAAAHVETLRRLLPDLYGDFQPIVRDADVEMAPTPAKPKPPNDFSRSRAERLVRDIEQIFEIRANSELEQPKEESPRPRCVFISHGRSNDWRAVQTYIEKDIELATIELAQEPALGRTVVEKLEDNAGLCPNTHRHK